MHPGIRKTPVDDIEYLKEGLELMRFKESYYKDNGLKGLFAKASWDGQAVVAVCDFVPMKFDSYVRRLVLTDNTDSVLSAIFKELADLDPIFRFNLLEMLSNHYKLICSRCEALGIPRYDVYYSIAYGASRRVDDLLAIEQRSLKLNETLSSAVFGFEPLDYSGDFLAVMSEDPTITQIAK